MEKQALDDLTLVKQAQQGDTASMEVLILRYRGLARSKARKFFLANGTFDDLLQEGLLGVFKAIRDFDEKKNDNFTSFAAMCVSSQITDAIRTSSRGKHKALNDALSLSDIDENIPDSNNSDPLDYYTMLENTENFYEKLKNLVKPAQLTVLKYYLDGYAYTEISQKLNMPLKKIDNILHSIRLKIKNNKELFK
ncbi:MAG TPA: sigma-70 family RNA polymerase sigma factor [Clostridia bacterium]|nr:sigma-70 family RNA polymerase sigma factor [Clostridia bacterium]